METSNTARLLSASVSQTRMRSPSVVTVLCSLAESQPNWIFTMDFDSSSGTCMWLNKVANEFEPRPARQALPLVNQSAIANVPSEA